MDNHKIVTSPRAGKQCLNIAKTKHAPCRGKFTKNSIFFSLRQWGGDKNGGSGKKIIIVIYDIETRVADKLIGLSSGKSCSEVFARTHTHTHLLFTQPERGCIAIFAPSQNERPRLPPGECRCMSKDGKGLLSLCGTRQALHTILKFATTWISALRHSDMIKVELPFGRFRTSGFYLNFRVDHKTNWTLFWPGLRGILFRIYPRGNLAEAFSFFVCAQI